jgi:rhomboid protease GluP
VARRRLEHPPLEASVALTATSVAILDQREQRLTQEERYGERMGPTAQGPARVTRVLALTIAGMFALQLLLGGSEDIEALYRLGALYSGDFGAGDSWRLLAAGFLHLGPVHLAMNLLGLLVLGPYLERALGGRRFLALYLLAGLLSSAMVLLLALALAQPTLLVGASGSIMGIIGGTGAVLLRGWRRERAAPAGRRLRVVAIMLVAQVVFDVMVPHVSMSAHLTGLLIGFVVASRMKHW